MGNQRNLPQRITRRESLRWLGLASAALAAASCTSAPTEEASEKGPVKPVENPTEKTIEKPAEKPTQTLAAQRPSGETYLAAAHGEDPAAITEAAVKALGGIERFVKKGFDVILKPNICTDYYSFEYAATTNPLVVATLVKLALGAGAKRVRVMDFPFGGSAKSAYERSGIGEAVNQAGGVMEVMNPNKFKKTSIPQGVSIKEWEIYQDILSCDLLINVPIAKHHSLAGLTLGGKNLLGVIQNRDSIHAYMGQRVADLISVIKPGLTVVDSVRILMDHGPTGGSLDDVKLVNTVIASHDIVAADTYAAGLFNQTGEDISYINAAAERGLGTLDLSTVKVEEINL
jgi:uncharacterized protein (DUF362 family)